MTGDGIDPRDMLRVHLAMEEVRRRRFRRNAVAGTLAAVGMGLIAAVLLFW